LIRNIAAEHAGKRLEVWFQDEARFGQQGTLTRVWAEIGSRPRAVKQTQYDYLYVLGAVCPQTGNSAGLLAANINTTTVNAFFEQMAKEIAPDVHVALIWDQAGYHTSGLLKVPANITLVPLPPRSPELNPIENLWHYLRSHHWSNRSYKNYDALREAACDAWQKSCLDPELMKTVCAAPWLEERN
jgi:transposase